MQVDRTELGALGSGADQVTHQLPAQRLPTFGQKKPRKDVVPWLQIAFAGPQLVTSDRVCNGEPICEPPNPYPRPLEVHVSVPHPNGFADAQPVATHHD